MSSLSSAPWTELSIDFSAPYLHGEYQLVIIDEYPRYSLIEVIQSTNAFTVIPGLERIFSMFGILKTLNSDYSPPSIVMLSNNLLHN